MKKGKLIIVEGPDFAGKSTCINSAIFDNSDFNTENLVISREPGSYFNDENYFICNEIRSTLLKEKTSIKNEALLFAASRYFHTLSIIDKLNKGFNVLCDRYFISSLCYQGLVLGSKKIYDYNKLALNLLKDYEVHNIIFLLSYDTYNKRRSYRKADAMEQVSEEVIKKRLDKFSNIDKDLKELELNSWIENLHFVDANASKEEVNKKVTSIINNIIG